MRSEPVIVLGPFPPPVHGFSVATEQLFQILSTLGPVQKFNLASSMRNPLAAKIGNSLRTIGAILVLVRFRITGGRKVSLGCNGGNGLALTYAILVACRWLGLSCVLHHHSYAYINDLSKLMARIVNVLHPSGTHVFLSRKMKNDFASRYGPIASAILPNAYMTPPGNRRNTSGTIITIGLISNLSRAKGLERFIELSRALKDAGVPFSARLAGPVADEDTLLLSEALANIPELTHVGPLYGDDKAAFLRELDLFVFPTSYRNEAQPIVIYEALAHGIPILSVDRGCISDQVGNCLAVMPDLASFDRDAAGVVASLASSNRERLENAKDMAQKRLAEDTAMALATIGSLFGNEVEAQCVTR